MFLFYFSLAQEHIDGHEVILKIPKKRTLSHFNQKKSPLQITSQIDKHC